MTDRTIKTLTGAAPQPGTGILHPFPTNELPHIDPFVFLDTGAPRNTAFNDYHAGAMGRLAPADNPKMHT